MSKMNLILEEHVYNSRAIMQKREDSKRRCDLQSVSSPDTTVSLLRHDNWEFRDGRLSMCSWLVKQT